jgi:hypothetical protein
MLALFKMLTNLGANVNAKGEKNVFALSMWKQP